MNVKSPLPNQYGGNGASNPGYTAKQSRTAFPQMSKCCFQNIVKFMPNRIVAVRKAKDQTR